MAKGAEEAMGEIDRPKTSNGVLTVEGEEEEESPIRGTRRARSRRDGRVGRPKTPQKATVLDKVNSFSVQELYQFLQERGESFTSKELMKDKTKSTFLTHLIKAHFPLLPNGRFSVKLRKIDENAKERNPAAVPRQAVRKLLHLIEQCDTQLKQLEMEETDHEHEKQEVMNRRIKHEDDLNDINRPIPLHEACKMGEIDVVAEVLHPEHR